MRHNGRMRPAPGFRIDPGTLLGLVFLALLLAFVPVLGPFLLGGVGLALLVMGRRQSKTATTQQTHGEPLAASDPVTVGQTITVVGAGTSTTSVTSLLSKETVALSVCAGYEDTSNIGTRRRVFLQVLGGPLEIASEGRRVRLSGEGVELLSSHTKTEHGNKGWSDERIAGWFSTCTSATSGDKGASRPVYELEESVVLPGETLTATGVVSDIADPEAGDAARVITLVPAEGAFLELTNLSPSELDKQVVAGNTTRTAGVAFLAIACLPVWCFYAHGMTLWSWVRQW
jgi:hypothetical protein